MLGRPIFWCIPSLAYLWQSGRRSQKRADPWLSAVKMICPVDLGASALDNTVRIWPPSEVIPATSMEIQVRKLTKILRSILPIFMVVLVVSLHVAPALPNALIRCVESEADVPIEDASGGDARETCFNAPSCSWKVARRCGWTASMDRMLQLQRGRAAGSRCDHRSLPSPALHNRTQPLHC